MRPGRCSVGGDHRRQTRYRLDPKARPVLLGLLLSPRFSEPLFAGTLAVLLPVLLCVVVDVALLVAMLAVLQRRVRVWFNGRGVSYLIHLPTASS